MTILIIAFALAIFHYGAITQLSLIMGRYQRSGIFPKRTLIANPYHIAGLAFLILAGVSIVIAMRVAGAVAYGDIAAAVLLAVDVVLIRLAIKANLSAR